MTEIRDLPPFRIFITDITTNEERLVDSSPTWEGPNAIEYLWTEGNFCCDCNRNLFFNRAANEPDNPDRTCGGERFILEVLSPTNEIIYTEKE